MTFSNLDGLAIGGESSFPVNGPQSSSESLQALSGLVFKLLFNDNQTPILVKVNERRMINVFICTWDSFGLRAALNRTGKTESCSQKKGRVLFFRTR